MRKITEDAVKAFENDKPFKRSNTEVKTGLNTCLYLHNNLIAKKDNGLWITSAGWNTVTTKERLNGFDEVNIIQRNGIWFLSDEEECVYFEWDGSLKKVR